MESEILGNLVKEHQALVKSIVYKYCKNGEDAKDLVSEVWTKVSLSIDGYKEEKDFVKWVAAIAHNTCIDYLRKRSTRVPSETFDEEKNSDVLTENENALAKDRIEVLKEALALMPEEDSLFIILHYFNGLSVKEMGKRFNLSQNAAKVRLYRAREKLRDSLKKIGYLENTL